MGGVENMVENKLIDNFIDELTKNVKREYSIFKEAQDIVLEMLDIVHRIFVKNKIKYYAAYGTLLGIYRDKALIPWDIDSDVIIDYRDMENAFDVLEKELPSDYYLISQKTPGKFFRFYQARVCKKSLDNDRIHVDIFYYFGAPDDKDCIKDFTAKVRQLFWQRYYLAQSISGIKLFFDSDRSILDKILHFYLKFRLCYKKIKLKSIDRYIGKIEKQYDIETAKYFVNFDAGATVFEIACLGTPQVLTFGSHELLVPQDVERYLNCAYKNFKEIPPFDVRFQEYSTGLSIARKALGHPIEVDKEYRKED